MNTAKDYANYENKNSGTIDNSPQKLDRKIAANIALIHEYDLKSKGVGNTSATQGELMREMVYQLIH